MFSMFDDNNTSEESSFLDQKLQRCLMKSVLLKGSKRIRFWTPAASLFWWNCIFRCINISLPAFFQARTLCVCMYCRCKQRMLRPTTIEVIKNVVYSVLSQFFLRSPTVRGGVPACPHTPLRTHHSDHRCYDCLSPLQMPVGVDESFTHCRHRAIEIPQRAQHSWLCSECARVTVWKWMSVNRRQR